MRREVATDRENEFLSPPSRKWRKEFDRSFARMRAMMAKIRNRPEHAVDEVKVLVEDIVERLLSEGDVTLHLMNGQDEFEDIYFHSLNVAVLSMLIGKTNNLEPAMIKELAFAALFHDMGKLKIPTAILRKTTRLTDLEQNYLKLHTKYGLELVSNIEGFPESAKRVIENHHETNDGTGYPAGLKAAKIESYADYRGRECIQLTLS